MLLSQLPPLLVLQFIITILGSRFFSDLSPFAATRRERLHASSFLVPLIRLFSAHNLLLLESMYAMSLETSLQARGVEGKKGQRLRQLLIQKSPRVVKEDPLHSLKRHLGCSVVFAREPLRLSLTGFSLSPKRLHPLLNLGFAIASVFISLPVQGAERIYIPYGPLEFSLPIASLDLYAKQGKIDPELAFYASHVDRQQLEQLRKILLTKIDVSPVAIAQFLYSPQGEEILKRLGEVIQTKAGQDGFYAIRAALIKAAAYPEGLTLLHVLQEFPTHGIRIDSARSFEIIENLSNLIQQTQRAIAAVNQEAITEAQAQTQAEYPTQLPPSFATLPDLRQPGSVTYVKKSFTLTDASRQRSLPVDLYLPNSSGGLIPLIVISHGLGSDRMTFAYLAAHLASYGFAVAVPEHPGSNAQQLDALSKGLASEVTPPLELVDRPLDIKFLLDELQRSYGQQINLQQVGVLGQSFGGYTTLALAGAKINFTQLQQDCAASQDSLNLSLLLQCRALELPPTEYQLQDQRVKAAIAINPVGSSIFGQSEFAHIQIPLMLVSGSNDTVAPALPEQIQPFTWLTTFNKYLVLMNKGTHFSALGESTNRIELPDSVIGPNPVIGQNYIKALSVAFFETYLLGQPEYQRYLSASYAQFLSEYPMPISLVESLTPEQLMAAPTAKESDNQPTEETPPQLEISPLQEQDLIPSQ